MTAFQQITRFNQGQPITESEMRHYAPSIFATEAHHSRSDRFVPVPTIEMVRGLQNEGWVAVMAGQSLTRLADKRDFTKHMVRFRRADRDLSVNGSVVELVLRNGNDGSSAYKLDAGIFRIACLNGLVAKSADYGEISVRHSGDAVNKVIEGSFEVLKSAERIMAAPQDWSRIQLSHEHRRAFAHGAHVERFADAEGNITTPIRPEQLLIARRPADLGTDLWSTFNVIQENTIRGGLTGRAAGRGHRRTTTREVRGIDQNVKLNKGLWAMAEWLAEHA